MVFAVAFPLLGGVLVYELLGVFPERFLPSVWSLNLYNAGIATVTIGSIMKGIFDIYGTYSRWIRFYALLACLLVCGGGIMWGVRCIRILTEQQKR